MKLVVGCGYLGGRVANRWLAAGHKVWAVTRNEAKGAEFLTQGIQPVVADLLQPSSLGNLPEFDTVLFAVGFDRSAGAPIREVYVEGLRNVLAALPNVGRFIYISSTGVYGQTAGDWVTESSPCVPSREGGIACFAAEELLQAHPFGERSLILRMSGIYGPNRIPRRDDLLAGRPIDAPSEGYLNLIHVDDAAQIVLAVEERACPPRLYLVSDGVPVPRRDYYRELARLIGSPEPQFSNPPADSAAALRAASDKRISNQRLAREIGLALSYPSYKEGLAAIVSGA